MVQISNNITLIGLAELREQMPKLSKDLKFKTVIITKRGKPVAVLEDFQKYEEKRDIIDQFEELVLGHLAKERDEKSKSNDYIPLGEVVKRLGIKL